MSGNQRAAHIGHEATYVLIALPNVDGTFACILFLPFEGKESFAQLSTPPAMIEFFRSVFRMRPSSLQDLANIFFANPTGAMVTIKCSPWQLLADGLSCWGMPGMRLFRSLGRE